ncbi:MAG: HNH endonuclease [Polaromonas sp.]|uniref:HNH endonuclease n=1 Tax=Polaromonas sp. TaxID=1869339 RepID=UPI0025CF9438|nr:HNH endonuclease [Polaromonas sp.]MBI2724620.1 HNH endonuclease [Polaromonas sp.]
MKRIPWSPVEIALLRDMYPHVHTEDMAAWLDRSMSSVRNTVFDLRLFKTPEFLKSDACKRMHSSSQKINQFKPGHKTWNAGMKGWAPAGSEHTRFQPGHKSTRTRPVGAERLDKDGVLMRKVSDTGYRYDDWKTVHSLIWAEANGPIPKGCIVVFKAGFKTSDKAAMDPKNMECLSRADLMRRNSYHRYPKEIALMYQLRGALNRQINKHQKATNEPHQHSTPASA